MSAEWTASGHGWVYPAAGFFAKCGGPAICPDCLDDYRHSVKVADGFADTWRRAHGGLPPRTSADEAQTPDPDYVPPDITVSTWDCALAGGASRPPPAQADLRPRRSRSRGHRPARAARARRGDRSTAAGSPTTDSTSRRSTTRRWLGPPSSSQRRRCWCRRAGWTRTKSMPRLTDRRWRRFVRKQGALVARWLRWTKVERELPAPTTVPSEVVPVLFAPTTVMVEPLWPPPMARVGTATASPLDAWLRHHYYCAVAVSAAPDSERCTCGLAAALTELGGA